jgi:hypothetical protein
LTFRRILVPSSAGSNSARPKFLLDLVDGKVLVRNSQLY